MPFIPVEETKKSKFIPVEPAQQPEQELFGVPDIDVSALPDPPKTDAKGIYGALYRGAVPYGAAAVAGGGLGLAGGPLAPVTVPGGALAGVGAMGLTQFAGDPLVAGINKFAGTNLTPPSQALDSLFTRMGVPKPDTPVERNIQLMAEGAASGPVQAGRSIPRQIWSGLYSAGMGEAARQGAENLGAGAKLQFMTSLTVGGGTGILTAPRAYAIDSPLVRYDVFGTPMNTQQMAVMASVAAKGDDFAKRQLASAVATGIDPATFRAAEEMGVSRYITPGQITTNKAFRELEESLAALPDSTAARVRESGLEEAAVIAHNLVADMFKVGDPRDISTTIAKTKYWMESLTNRLKARGDKHYANLSAAIDPKLRTETKTLVSVLEQKMEKLSGETGQGPVATKSGVKWSKPPGYEKLSPIEKQAYDRLRPVPRMDGKGGFVYEYPTYYNVDETRKMIGRAQDNSLAFPDEDQFNLGTMYDALTRDQEAYVKRSGADIAEWELAKGYVKQRKAVEDSMSVLFGKKLDESFQLALSGSIDALAKGDTARFQEILSQVPKSMRQQVVLSGIMSSVNKNAAAGMFDFGAFSKWYYALDKQGTAYNTIMGNLPPETRRGLKNIAQVGAEISATGKKYPGYVVGAIEQSNSLMNRLYYAAGRAANVVALQNTIAGVLNSRAATYSLAYNVTGAVQSASKNKALLATNRLIGSPEFMDLVRAMARGDDIPKYVSSLSKTQAAVTWARAAGLPARQKEIEQWLTEGLTFMEYERDGTSPAQEEQ